MSDIDQLVEDLERYYLINDYRFVRAAIETYVADRISPYRQGLAFIAEHGRYSFDREQARRAIDAGDDCGPPPGQVVVPKAHMSGSEEKLTTGTQNPICGSNHCMDTDPNHGHRICPACIASRDYGDDSGKCTCP